MRIFSAFDVAPFKPCDVLPGIGMGTYYYRLVRNTKDLPSDSYVRFSLTYKIAATLFISEQLLMTHAAATYLKS